jgi:hypothetical protein
MKVRVIILHVIIINPALANEVSIDDLNADLSTFDVGNFFDDLNPVVFPVDIF